MLTYPSAQQELPVACDLMAIPADEREQHIANAAHLFSVAVLERQALPDGYAFRFAADDYGSLAAFIANERRCCSFFHFGLELTPAGGPIWLKITGSEGVKAFIEAEFVKRGS